MQKSVCRVWQTLDRRLTASTAELQNAGTLCLSRLCPNIAWQHDASELNLSADQKHYAKIYVLHTMAGKTRETATTMRQPKT